MKIGIFVDLSNIYYCVKSKYNSKVSYRKLWDFVSDLGEIKYACAYGSQIGDEAERFIKKLRRYGYQVRFKQPKEMGGRRKADWDVGIAIDVLAKIDQYDYDTVVLVTADGDMQYLIWELKRYVKNIIVMGTGISYELKNIDDVTCIELPESLLEA